MKKKRQEKGSHKLGVELDIKFSVRGQLANGQLANGPKWTTRQYTRTNRQYSQLVT